MGDESLITLSKSSVMMYNNGSISITAEAFKADGVTADTITAQSNDESIATVTVDGETIVIEALSIGQTTITVTTDDASQAGSVNFSN